MDKSELEELYNNLIDIFKDINLLNGSIKENLFDLEIIKLYTLLFAYFHICDNIPKDILEKSLDCDISENDYKLVYDFISDKWLNKANAELDDIIFMIEHDNDI